MTPCPCGPPKGQGTSAAPPDTLRPPSGRRRKVAEFPSLEAATRPLSPNGPGPRKNAAASWRAVTERHGSTRPRRHRFRAGQWYPPVSAPPSRRRKPGAASRLGRGLPVHRRFSEAEPPTQTLRERPIQPASHAPENHTGAGDNPPAHPPFSSDSPPLPTPHWLNSWARPSPQTPNSHRVKSYCISLQYR